MSATTATSDSVLNRQGGEGERGAPTDDYWPSGVSCLVVSSCGNDLHSLITAATLADAGYDVTLLHSTVDTADNAVVPSPPKRARWSPPAESVSTVDPTYRQRASTTYSKLYSLSHQPDSGVQRMKQAGSATEAVNCSGNESNATWFPAAQVEHLIIDTATLYKFLRQRFTSNGGQINTTEQSLPPVDSYDVVRLWQSVLQDHHAIVVDCRSKQLRGSDGAASVDMHVAGTSAVDHTATIRTAHRTKSLQTGDPLVYICNHPYITDLDSVITTSFGCAREVVQLVQRAHRFISSAL